MPPETRYDLDPTDPNLGAPSKNYYRDLWLADLSRLEEYTKEVESKGTADNEFWKMMYMRLSRAFAPDPMYGVPPPGMVMNGAIPDGEDGTEEKDGDGDLEEED